MQTWVSQKLVEQLSQKLGTKIAIKGVDIRPFRTFILEGIYIEDQHRDTLLYAEELRLDIRDFDRKLTYLIIEEVSFKNSRINLFWLVREDAMNYQFMIDAFASDNKDTTASPAIRIHLEALQLKNVDFSYRDLRDTIKREGMNYWDIHAPNVFGEFTDIAVKADTIRAKIESLNLREQCGFQLEGLSAYVNVNPKRLKLDELKIKTPHTSIKSDLVFHYQEYEDVYDFINKVTMDVKVHQSTVSFIDIAYFAPELMGIRDKVAFTGQVRGKVKKLRGRDLDIYFAQSTHFQGNADLDGLPYIDETLLFIDVDHFSTNKKDLEKIPVPPFSKGNRLEMPENIALLGDVDFKGNFSGYLSNFVAYGKLKTDLGNVDADIQME